MITLRQGSLGDAEAFVRFLEEIRQEMPEKDWLYLDPPELVRKMVAEGTMALWFAEDAGRIAAVFSILCPGMDPCNYGYDLNLTEGELRQVVHMDTAAVHLDYRGQGLQGRMLRAAEEALSGSGRKILLSTVHPENRFSLGNLLKQGYEIQKRVNKYGSERYILRKNIF